jgi:hypothetical protein
MGLDLEPLEPHYHIAGPGASEWGSGHGRAPLADRCGDLLDGGEQAGRGVDALVRLSPTFTKVDIA